MCPYRYYDVMRKSKDPTHLRYQMVLSVERWGLKATARDFHTSRNTVRKWHRRWHQEGYRGLRELSRRPHYSPNATPPEERRELVELRRTYKRLGAEAIIAIEGLCRSPRTIRKIWREEGISSRCRRKKHKVSQRYPRVLSPDDGQRPAPVPVHSP
jgi:transposase